MTIILYLLGLIVLLAMSAFFSGAETAIVGISQAKVHRLVKEGQWGAESLARLKKNMRNTLTAILIGNNIVNTVISSLATLLVIELFGSLWVGVGIGLIFLAILMFGEIFPKTFSTSYTRKIAPYVAPPVEALIFVLSPLIYVVQFVPNIVLRSKEADRRIVSERELHDLVELGMEEKVLEKNEAVMIKKVLLFNDISVREIMTPINQVAKISADCTIEKVVNEISKYSYTRYPVVDNNGKIIGNFKVKNLFRHIYDNKNMKISDITDQPLFFDAQTKIDDAYGLMKLHHRHIAYVREENGDVVGIITTEDILGELVGDSETYQF